MSDRPVEIGMAHWWMGPAPHQCQDGVNAYLGHGVLPVWLFASGARRYGCVCDWFRWEAP